MYLRVVYIDLILSLFLIRQLDSKVLLSQDQTSPRANTLQDDADDLQRQLDNEARDRIKFGKALRVGQRAKFKRDNVYIHYKLLPRRSIDWNYLNQNEWQKIYPECGGRSQSPVDLPDKGLVQAIGARKLLFKNYDVMPNMLELQNDGKLVTLTGEWNKVHKPFIYGGAGHSRRYIFHSMSFHWPSEHSIGGLRYPMESQVIHMSAEYQSLQEAINASALDPQAFLGVVNMYKYSNYTHPGLEQLLKATKYLHSMSAMPLEYYNPPFKEYACYQGSLTVPPCSESVLWLVRAHALPVTRELAEMAESILSNGENSNFFRTIQPLNDRKTFYFKN